MAIDLNRVFDSLLERNPNLDHEELVAAFQAAALSNDALAAAVAKAWAEIAYPLVKKIANGEQLTADEQKRWDALGGSNSKRRA